PDLDRPSVSFLTGLPFQSAERSTVTSWRWPGVLGLYCFSAMASDPCGHVDRVTLFQGHHCLLVVAADAQTAAEALQLALLAQRVDRLDLDLEEGLDRRLDLRLAGVQRDLEGHLVVLGAPGRLLGDDRTTDHLVHALGRHLGRDRVAWTSPAHFSRASSASTAARVSTS